VVVLAVVMTTGYAARAEAAADDAKRADIRKLLELTGSGKMGVMVIQNMLGQFKKSMPDVPQKFWDDFINECKPDELIELCIPAYEKNLSHEDIKAAIVFYQSKPGKRVLAAQPQIMQESMKAGQEWGRALAQKVMDKLKADGLQK
jgi:hypothetical protein